jgi:hypothetical protein
MNGELFVTALLALTAVPILLGALLGLLRGCNRSILRLVLVILCAVGAFFLKDMLVNVVLNISIDGETIEETISSAVVSEIPEALSSMVISLVRVIIGLVAFLAVFFVLQFVSWLILFPILKIFVRKGQKKRAFLGMVFGIVQGVFVAFVFCAPLSGALVQVDKISKMNFQGETVGQMAELPDLTDAVNSPLCKLYSSSGAWLFNAVTTYKDTDGNDVTLDDTVQAADTGVKVMEEVTKIQENLDKLQQINNGNSAGTNEDGEEIKKSDVLRDVAGSLSNMDQTISSTSDGGKQVLQSLISGLGEMVDGGNQGGGSEGQPGQGGDQEQGGGSDASNKINEVLEKIDVNNLKLDSAAQAIEGVADYIDKGDGVIEELPEDTAEKIVNGLADNFVIVDMLPENEALVELPAEDKEKFQQALDKVETLTQEEKDKLAQLLGLEINR